MVAAWVKWLPLWLRRARLDVTWITPDWGIGAAPPPDLLPAVTQAGFHAVLDLRAEASPDPFTFAQQGLRLLHMPVPDGQAPTQDQIAQGTSWVWDELAAGHRVLICCQAGSGRSVALACALLITMGYPLSQTLPLVVRRRSVAQPTEDQMQAVYAFAAGLRRRQS